MSITLAQKHLEAKLHEVFDYNIAPHNADVSKDSTCYLYLFITSVKSLTHDFNTYRYFFKGVVQLSLSSPCMAPIGYLLDRKNYAVANAILGGLALDKEEERLGVLNVRTDNNKIQMKFTYLSDLFEFNPNDNIIKDINITVKSGLNA